MRRVIRYVKATAILHNLLVKHEIDENWIIPEDDSDDSDDEEMDDTLGTDLDENGLSRRDQIHNYLDLLLN